MLDKLKKALVLFLIGVISGISIWGVNELTKDTIAENERNRELDFYREMLTIEGDVELGTVEVDLGDGVTEVTVFEDVDLNENLDPTETVFGLVYKGETTNSYGDVTVLVAIKDDAILSVVISGSTNTPNFVKRVENNNLENFDDMDVNDVTFDEKTGATFTYGSVKEIVTNATQAYVERGDE